MGALASAYIKEETLDIILKTIRKKGEKGIKLTINVNDKSNEHGNNVSIIVEQTKEQRQAKEKPFYVGNGKVFWTDGVVIKGEKPEPKDDNSQPKAAENNNSGGGEYDTLPF